MLNVSFNQTMIKCVHRNVFIFIELVQLYTDLIKKQI